MLRMSLVVHCHVLIYEWMIIYVKIIKYFHLFSCA